jgi:NADPH2:quinone reductase
VLSFTAGIASLPMNPPLLKSCVLGINWRTFTLSQPAANAANRVELFAMYERGAIAPVITAALPLDRAEAIARLQDRSAMGKVVVMI